MIKMFEEYNDYYVEVKKEVMDNVISNIVHNKAVGVESMSHYECNAIRKLIEIESSYFNSTCYLKSRLFYNHTKMEYDYRYGGPINIIKLVDDYFIIEFFNINSGSLLYYKCDQLEGLIKLIKDLIL